MHFSTDHSSTDHSSTVVQIILVHIILVQIILVQIIPLFQYNDFNVETYTIHSIMGPANVCVVCGSSCCCCSVYH